MSLRASASAAESSVLARYTRSISSIFCASRRSPHPSGISFKRSRTEKMCSSRTSLSTQTRAPSEKQRTFCGRGGSLSETGGGTKSSSSAAAGRRGFFFAFSFFARERGRRRRIRGDTPPSRIKRGRARRGVLQIAAAQVQREQEEKAHVPADQIPDAARLADFADTQKERKIGSESCEGQEQQDQYGNIAERPARIAEEPDDPLKYLQRHKAPPKKCRGRRILPR